jgi:hypothetical protein
MKRRASSTLLLALALAAAAPARAQTTPPPRHAKSAAPAPARTPAPAPAAEPLPTVVVAPPPAAPVAAIAAPSVREAPFATAWRAAVLFGPEFIDNQTGMRLRVDLERDVLPLSPRAALSLVLSASGTYLGDKTTTGSPGLAAITVDSTATTFELVPSLRARFEVTRALWLHVDAGLGGAFSTARVETKADVLGLVTTAKSSSSAGGVVLRGGLGGAYAVTERVSIGAELIGFNAHYGDTRGRTVTLLAGLGFKL